MLRGRPSKQAPTVALKIAVPQQLWSYLTLLARGSLLGDSETEVALFVLKERLLELQREDFHTKAQKIDAIGTAENQSDLDVENSEDLR